MSVSAPGVTVLASQPITAATAYVGDWFDGFEGIESLTAQFRLEWGGAGSVIKCYLQTTLDDGEVPIDIGCVTFATAAKTVLYAFTKIPVLTAVVPTNGALADDTAINGLLGPKFRVRFTSTGTAYTGSTVLTVRVNAS